MAANALDLDEIAGAKIPDLIEIASSTGGLSSR
jgi:hypothetical protein